MSPAPPHASPSVVRRRPSVSVRLLSLALLGILLTALAACGDDPFLLRWQENPREATLFSLDRPELNRPQAFDMLQGRRVIVQSAQEEGRWDFAVDRRDGQMVFLPPRTLGVVSEAALVPLPNIAFDEIRDAPADTAVYITREPVPIQTGTLYVVRTHQQSGPFGQICFYYGKLEPLEVNLEAGTVRFLFDTSPDCNNRRLVPPGS
ncbi:MAG: hypothetical protein EA421_00305 [Gemmatimonadales bacterium]|nr:MAG: hypothetical protein EA421_00305 [Gemmatimonadales bacterium]